MKTKRPIPWKRFCLWMSFLLCCLSPCSVWAGNEELGKTATGSRDRSTPLPDYQFVPGDTIELKFFYNPDMNEVIQIRPDGKIAMPLIGDVELDGKTVTAASKMIEELYVPHLKTPRVTIQIRSYAAQKVYVGGEVQRPGVVNLSSELTVLDAIMEAGGRKVTGSSSTVVLVRRTPDNTPQMQKIPLTGEDGQFSEQVMTLLLRPYDVVLVPETKIARLNRWVDQYIRQVVPFTMYASFSYILNPGIFQK